MTHLALDEVVRSHAYFISTLSRTGAPSVTEIA
jgi:hypothetical protein